MLIPLPQIKQHYHKALPAGSRALTWNPELRATENQAVRPSGEEAILCVGFFPESLSPNAPLLACL